MEQYHRSNGIEVNLSDYNINSKSSSRKLPGINGTNRNSNPNYNYITGNIRSQNWFDEPIVKSLQPEQLQIHPEFLFKMGISPDSMLNPLYKGHFLMIR